MVRKMVLWAALMSAVGCGGGSDDGGIDLDDLDSKLGAAICDARISCETFPDVATCLESIVIRTEQEQEGVKTGRVIYDETKAQECVDTLINTSCDAFQSGSMTRAGCDDIFTGTVDVGGDCFSSAECVGDAFCVGTTISTCTQGTCVGRSGVGDSCSNFTCVSGSFCSDGVCVSRPELAKLGETCETSVDCDISSPYCIDGACVTFPKRGEACGVYFFETGDVDVPCGDIRDYCGDLTDAITICKRRIGVGEACSESEQPENACVSYATCQSGMCVAIPGLGDACSNSDTSSCLEALDCDNGICVVFKDAPEVCTI